MKTGIARAGDRRNTRVAAALFDLDGVLVDSQLVVHRAWRRWAGELNVSITEVLAHVHGRPARDVVRTFTPHLDAMEQAQRIARYEEDCASELKAVPGAREAIDVVCRGRWAVVTSGSRDLATKRLAAVGIPSPPVLITADDVANGKPDPEPYEQACRQLAVDAAKCVVVEDSPAGVLAARRAGLTVFAVTTTHGARSLDQADRVFHTMRDVARHLQTLTFGG